MKRMMVFLVCITTASLARNSYTGGYSSSPGSSGRCASSCHGGTNGTLVVSGFPAVYQPQQTYRIVIKRNGGSLMVNFNATTRIGSGTTVAGTFSTVTNTALFAGSDGGVYGSPKLVDSAVFQWRAPASGTGTVNFFACGYQGTTSSANGQSTRITLSATESTTDVEPGKFLPQGIMLEQNYPNPFNPSTTFAFRIGSRTFASLKIFDSDGGEVATVVSEELPAGVYTRHWSADWLASGIYFYRLEAGGFTEARKFVLLK